MSPDEPVLELAERALAAAPPGDDALALVTAERSLTMRFALSRPTQSTAIDDLTVLVAVSRSGRVGTATTNLTDTESLRACGRAAAGAAAAAERTAGPGSFPGFPAAEPPPASRGRADPELAALDPAAGGSALADAFAACAEMGTEAHGTWTAGDVSTGVASRAGARASDRGTDVYMKVTAFGPRGRSGFASVAASRLDGVRPRELASRAAAKAAFPGEVVGRLEPGTYPVVLEADAAGELIAWLGYLAHNGLAYAEGRSALCGRLGSRVTAARINLADSPRHPRTLPRLFDAEGVPKAPLPLIQDGVAHAVVHDTRSAALCDAVSTGHALVPGGSASGPEPLNLVLMGGGAASEEDLCAPISRGVYVTRLWYTNPVREKETLLTGVTRDGTFLIEDGVITRPLEDMRFTDSVLGVLDRCEDLGAASSLWSEGEFYGRRSASGVVAPPMRTVLRFTG